LDGDTPWLTFAARAETSVAAAPADAAAGQAPDDDANADEPSATAPQDAVATAEAITARVGGWRYRVPEHQHGQLTRRWADLLKAPE
jgi:hypothetical protein